MLTAEILPGINFRQRISNLKTGSASWRHEQQREAIDETNSLANKDGDESAIGIRSIVKFRNGSRNSHTPTIPNRRLCITKSDTW